jgi:hypothetical protein
MGWQGAAECGPFLLRRHAAAGHVGGPGSDLGGKGTDEHSIPALELSLRPQDIPELGKNPVLHDDDVCGYQPSGDFGAGPFQTK